MSCVTPDTNELKLHPHWSSDFKIWDSQTISPTQQSPLISTQQHVSGKTWLGYKWAAPSTSDDELDDDEEEEEEEELDMESHRISRICLELPMIVQSLNPDAKDFEPKSYRSEDPPKLDQESLIQSDDSLDSVPNKIRVVVKKVRYAPVKTKRSKTGDGDKLTSSIYYPADPAMPEGGIYFPAVHGMVSNKFCAFTLPHAAFLDFAGSEISAKQSPKYFTSKNEMSPRMKKLQHSQYNPPPRMQRQQQSVTSPTTSSSSTVCDNDTVTPTSETPETSSSKTHNPTPLLDLPPLRPSSSYLGPPVIRPLIRPPPGCPQSYRTVHFQPIPQHMVPVFRAPPHLYSIPRFNYIHLPPTLPPGGRMIVPPVLRMPPSSSNNYPPTSHPSPVTPASSISKPSPVTSPASPKSSG